MTELPDIENEKLAICTPAELIDIMIAHEDRVPRNVIDECARRGEQMLDSLAPIAQPDDKRETEAPGYWWLRLHAVMILGLIPSESAGRLLVAFVHGMNRDEDFDLQDWLGGYWPALMLNKPPVVIALLRDMCEIKKIDWYIRSNLTEAVISGSHQQGGTVLEETLDWAAQFIADEEEDWDYRFFTSERLLSYPRERHRALITKLSSREHGLAAFFSDENVDQAYARGTDIPVLDDFSNPWSFYERKEIEQRQRRWQ
ncbi:MAG: hypothetical protein GXP17_09095, partial [Gammaproteobacteria bacterium]|nr:hypothetical protein [Gammaproteobacteria bacterium]